MGDGGGDSFVALYGRSRSVAEHRLGAVAKIPGEIEFVDACGRRERGPEPSGYSGAHGLIFAGVHKHFRRRQF